MIYLLIIISTLGWLLAFYFWYVIRTDNPKRWRTEFPPEDAVRGPNADSSYQAVNLDGVDHWFTDEEVDAARERARKYSR